MQPTQDPNDLNLVAKLTPLVNQCMSIHDPSHNPAHVQRVVALARHLLATERAAPSTTHIPYNPLVVDLAALLHDIADHKYLSSLKGTIAMLLNSSTPNPTHTDNANDNANNIDNARHKYEENELTPQNLITHLLTTHGAPLDLATRVQTTVSHISYSTEKANPASVRNLIDNEGYHELALVQDADRLDAIGAIGIGRCFTFLGAKGKDFIPAGQEWDMQNAVEHFGDKLERLEGMMKTEAGRKMARERMRRLVEFRGWWEEEMELLS